MTLYILRHGIAAERRSRWSGHDEDRPLTTKGAKKVLRIVEAMKDLDLSFDLVLSSPFRRARETAEIAADLLECSDRLEYSAHLKVGGNPTELIKEIKAHRGNFKNILIIGHEPYLSSLISVLISGKKGVAITLKKGGICKLTIDSLRFGRCATLEWLLGPSQLLHSH